MRQERSLKPLLWNDLCGADSKLAASGCGSSRADIQVGVGIVVSWTRGRPLCRSLGTAASKLEVAIRNRANGLPDSEALADVWRSKFCARNQRKLGVSWHIVGC
ncbi:hypothetical protein BQ8482_20062 [Mesorhizobium delmotii]|uniref:Uncharacterized protein n=1 Tax=Mesorhizobium delmotii TaxID=1631247 RepID=A0A2P9AK38_9HYPH|nr:hypothetical protein BQ8482_20062 [Mesorhizobium delmotii]